MRAFDLFFVLIDWLRAGLGVDLFDFMDWLRFWLELLSLSTACGGWDWLY